MRKRSAKRLRFFIFFVALSLTIIYVLNNTATVIYPLKYRDYVKQYSVKYGVDPYLVLAIIRVESNFNKDAVSPKMARGLMQISEKTGSWGADELKIEHYSTDLLFDPRTNILIGCWYLSVLFNEFGNTDLVLAAYNGGSGNVNQWLRDNRLSTSGKSLDKIPYKETEKYLVKVKNSYKIYKTLYENKL